VPVSAQTASSPSSKRRVAPLCDTQPMRRAGTPAISAYGGTSLVTTAPAATNAHSPMVTPQTMVALAPMLAPWHTRVTA
jgi:hypothetical protein